MPSQFFDERKQVTIRLLFFSKSQKYSAYFINKLVCFTSGKVKFNVIWNTRKIQSLFPLKDKVQYLNCVTYKGICSCEETQVGETIRNCKIRWDPNKFSESAKYLAKYLSANSTKWSNTLKQFVGNSRRIV